MTSDAIIKFRVTQEESERLKTISAEHNYKTVSKFIVDAINEKAGSEIISSDKKRGDYDHKAPARKAREEAEKQGIIYSAPTTTDEKEKL